jgi:type II secretory pathway predicted ATPase ExeA
MSGAMTVYTDYFGLSERPFTLLPDPEFLFWSDEHTHAYTMLEYGLVTHAPITMVTGEIGAGKTTLVRELLANMPVEFTVGLISNAQGGRGELLQWVLYALNQEVDHTKSYVQLFQQFQDFLIGEYAEGRRTVLIFDEAQNLDVETLEELRMFSNINADKDELLQLILLGQPQLLDLVNRPELVQFRQRIVAQYHLPNMSFPAVCNYIHHRMEIAGAINQIFTQKACERVYLASHGTPRLVNQLCDFALTYAFSEGKNQVDAETIEQVIKDRERYSTARVRPEPPERRVEPPKGNMPPMQLMPRRLGGTDE